MAPIEFSQKFLEKYPETWDYVQQGYWSELISYIIDSNKRKAVILQNWLSEGLAVPSLALIEIAKNIRNGIDYDDQALICLKWIRANVKYQSDQDHWKVPEVWTHPNDFASILIGDCEDGALLLYALLRLKGVPYNRLLLWAGDVQQSANQSAEGHCCLFYKPQTMPLNFVAMDWCYWPNTKTPMNRGMLELYNKNVSEYIWNSGWEEIWSHYRRTWFCCNENVSYSRFILKEV